jgi:AcrR family transcriptional regulator
MVQEKSYNFVISNFYKKFTDRLLCQLESVFVVNQTEQKKKAILEITFQLLNEKRIKDIKIEEIAKKAVVSKVTLFKYYQNKSHLMNYVLLKSFEHMVDEIEEIINGDLDFTDTFQAIIDLELKQLKVFSPVFSENLMTQYSESPDFF